MGHYQLQRMEPTLAGLSREGIWTCKDIKSLTEWDTFQSTMEAELQGTGNHSHSCCRQESSPRWSGCPLEMISEIPLSPLPFLRSLLPSLLCRLHPFLNSVFVLSFFFDIAFLRIRVPCSEFLFIFPLFSLGHKKN